MEITMEKYIFDILLAAIFLFEVIKNFRKGFAKTILDFIAFILAIVFAKSFSIKIMDWVFKNTNLFSGTDKYIAKLIIIVLSFVVLLTLLKWAAELLNRVVKLPVLKQANKILGGLLGALNGIILIVILSIVLQISSHVVYNSKYVSAVESSVIVQTVLSDEKVTNNINALK